MSNHANDAGDELAACIAEQHRWHRRYGRRWIITDRQRKRDDVEWADIVNRARAALDLSRPDHVTRVANALRGNDRPFDRLFVMEVLGGYVGTLSTLDLHLPDALLGPLVDAALINANPSSAGPYMKLVRHHSGTPAGIDELRARLLAGPAATKLAARWALYHLAGHPPERHDFNREVLRAFLESDRPEDQSVLLYGLLQRRDMWEPADLPRVDAAFEIARAHPDELTRAVAEQHLGNKGPMQKWDAANRHRFSPYRGLWGKWRWFVRHILKADVPW